MSLQDVRDYLAVVDGGTYIASCLEDGVSVDLEASGGDGGFSPAPSWSLGGPLLDSPHLKNLEKRNMGKRD